MNRKFKAELDDHGFLAAADASAGSIAFRKDILKDSMPRLYRNSEPALVYLGATILAHEFLHLGGLWHPYATAAEELVPAHSYDMWDTRSYNIMDVTGGPKWVLERAREPRRINRTVTDFQRKQLRSFLQGRVAFREFAKRKFHLRSLQDDVEAYMIQRESERIAKRYATA